MDTETGLLARYSREIGRAQGEMRETQIRNYLLSIAEQHRVFAGDATSIGEVGSDDILTFADLRMMDKALKDARCPKATKLIDGSTKYGTAVVGKARYVYVPTELIPTLEDMEHNGKSVWTPVEMYAAAGTIAQDEIGRIGQFRFIEVEDMPNYAGQGADTTDATDDAEVANRYTSEGADGKIRYDVFPTLFVGSGSFATVGFEGDSARVTTVMPKPDAWNAPYGKKGAVSISWYWGCLILRNEWLRVILSSAKIA
jgi:N4-gp56 family major capsid protein